MNRAKFFVVFAVAMIASCGEEPRENTAEEMIAIKDSAPQNEFGFMEAMDQGPTPFERDGPSAESLARSAERALETDEAPEDGTEQQAQPVAAAQQQIAYSYSYGFRIEQENIPALQQRHVALCESMGAGCRMVRMSQAGTDSYDGYGELHLRVDSSRARAFGTSLSKPAEELGGERVSFVVDGEDLTETIIDTDAKLQSRLVLRDKLTAILRNNRGSVDELVKAERAVAEVNAEIDAGRSKLQELRNRIRLSSIAIEYNPYLGVSSTGFWEPVSVAFSSIGTTLGRTIAILVYLATALVPITIFLLCLRWLWLKSGFRIRRRREKTSEETV